MKHNKIQQQDILVSIGLPVYNGEAFIKQAIESLLGQSYKNIELIISDNASTDNTPKICIQYKAKDSRIRYLQQPSNIGIVANFQLVLDESVGEYFMWAACDDYWDLNWIETLLSNMLEEPNAIGAIGKIVFVKECGEAIASHSDNRVSCNTQMMELGSGTSAIKRLISFLSNRNDMAIYSLFKKKCMNNTILRTGPFTKKLFDLGFPIIYHMIYQGCFLVSPETTIYKKIHTKQYSSITPAGRVDSMRVSLNHVYLTYKQLRAANASIIVSVTFTLYLFIYLSLVWIKYVFKSIFNSQF
jgi:glycosyltransferase involved in cell wall biosynthesis